MLVLEFIYDTEENYTQKDLCDKLMLPKQVINSIIKSFWEQGYVELREAKDRRNKEIILTAQGKKYAKSILHPMQCAESKAWECFTEEEIIAFVEMMEKYEKSFEQILRNVAR
jgi:DNA-binding MarR family transcriptional regulator